MDHLTGFIQVSEQRESSDVISQYGDVVGCLAQGLRRPIHGSCIITIHKTCNENSASICS